MFFKGFLFPVSSLLPHESINYSNSNEIWIQTSQVTIHYIIHLSGEEPRGREYKKTVYFVINNWLMGT